MLEMLTQDWSFMMMGTLLTVVATLWAWQRLRTTLSLPSGPWGVPVLGYLPWLDEQVPHESLTDLARRYGPIYSLRLGSVLAVVLSDCRIIRQALSQEACSGRAPLFLTHGIMQGYGLICAEGERWKEQRRFVAGCLRTLGMVKVGARRDKMEHRIGRCVQQCLERLRKLCEEPMDPSLVLLDSMGNAISSLVFGKTWEENDPVWRWLANTQEEGTKLIGVAGAINFLPFLRFLPKYQRTMEYLLSGKEKSHQLYASMIAEHNSEADDVIGAFLSEMKRRNDIGDEGFYTVPQFHHLLADLFGAGLDTTLTTLRWFILFMAQHPNVQARIHEELDEVLGKRWPTLNDAPVLSYTQAAISETQRIRSVVPVGIPHGTTQVTTIEGYRIPAGTMIIPLQWAVHMDPEVWPEPEEFRPERFLLSDGRYYKRENFIPFQTGKRVCVGEELAHMLLFLFGATILHQFQLSVPPGVELDLRGENGITLTPKHQCLVFTPRHGTSSSE
ncbi:cytochrome P450 306a1 [Anabrus simplex]|uniref:cytochrome P450 306a1 n=1 Tax=Anabrus simplex TaxID=316456 RepID=UPI0035A2E63C